MALAGDERAPPFCLSRQDVFIAPLTPVVPVADMMGLDISVQRPEVDSTIAWQPGVPRHREAQPLGVDEVDEVEEAMGDPASETPGQHWKRLRTVEWTGSAGKWFR